MWTLQLWSIVRALKEVKSTPFVKQHSAGGGRNDYYSKPLNEFKNSYFSAFAIQSLCLGLMQKMPFAFLLRVELCALMRTRITVTANSCDNLCCIIIHDHLYGSFLSGIFESEPAVQHMYCAHTPQNSGMEVWCRSDPSCCSTLPSQASVFSWCKMLGS